MPYVISTLSNDQEYCHWEKSGDRSIPRKVRSVVIKGGANVAQAGTKIFTPNGVATKVSEEVLAFLKSVPSFLEHMKNGFLQVAASNDTNKAAKSMTGRDTSAPATPTEKRYRDVFKPKVGEFTEEEE